MNGLELMNRLHKDQVALPIVVLTNYHSDEDIFQAFQAGAMAYLLKSASGEDLLNAIRAVLPGGDGCRPLSANSLPIGSAARSSVLASRKCAARCERADQSRNRPVVVYK